MSSRSLCSGLILISLCLFAHPGHAGDAVHLGDLLDPVPELNPSIPTPAALVGVEVGERHWYHHEVLQYLDALAEASPRVAALGEHGRTYGGRPLVSYAISSAGNIAKLDQIRKNRAKLIDPDSGVKLEEQPVIVQMGYSIHGNEPSGGNVAPLVAYYFAAAQDPALQAQLEHVVILFSPVFNPDGFDRFAHWTNSHRGLNPSKDPNDREHVEAFPGSRTNYYWFDLNRDWLAHQHPESQGRLKLFHEWKPNVLLDFHEQGSGSSYFFMPGMPNRTNPLTPALNQELTMAMADFHSRTFDEDGILYFSQERYDDFFAGKGSTYPDLFGSVGILFEQASSRGAHQETANGLLTFPLSIANQFKTSLSSLEATAHLKSALLDYQRSFYQNVATAAKSASGHYLATATGDPTRLREFVRVLQGHQIEVELLSESIEANGETYPAHTSIAIPLAQTQSTYLHSLWKTQIEFEENIFYDVSTWTLPYAFNLQHTRTAVKGVSSAPLPDDFHSPKGNAELPHSEIGYLIDWQDSAAPAVLYALLDAGANVRVATRPLTATLIGGEEKALGYGTLLVAKALNAAIPEEAVSILKTAAAQGVPIYPVASSFTREGIDLGSREFTVLQKPSVLLVTGAGMSAYDAGEIWHLADRRIQMPITMVDTNRLGSVDFQSYTHVIITRGLGSLSEAGVNQLKAFVEGGGILWAQGEQAIQWVADKKLAEVVWRKTAAEKAKEEKDSEAGEHTLPERRPFAEARDDKALKLVRGAIFATSLDITHPIGYGYSADLLPVMRRTNKFLEPSANAYSTPVLYRPEPLLSGYINAENLRLIAGSAGIVIDQRGDGAVVLALDNPTFRGFWWGTQRLLVNGIFFGDLLEEPE